MRRTRPLPPSDLEHTCNSWSIMSTSNAAVVYTSAASPKTGTTALLDEAFLPPPPPPAPPPSGGGGGGGAFIEHTFCTRNSRVVTSGAQAAHVCLFSTSATSGATFPRRQVYFLYLHSCCAVGSGLAVAGCMHVIHCRATRSRTSTSAVGCVALFRSFVVGQLCWGRGGPARGACLRWRSSRIRGRRRRGVASAL